MTVNRTNTDRRTLRDYLLGRLPEDQAEQLDSQLFADDALRQELEEEQDALIDDSIYGRLSEEEEKTFHEQCARSVHLREKVASLRLLVSALERQDAPSPAPFVWSPRKIFTVLSPALALVLCFAVFLYVRERHRGADQVSQATPPVASTAESAQPNLHTLPVVAFLSANVVRGSSSVPKIKIPSAGNALELQVEVHTVSSVTGSWDVALMRGSDVIQSSANVQLHQLGQLRYLSLTIDAASLQAGSYSVRYSPHSNPDVRRYRPFQAVH